MHGAASDMIRTVYACPGRGTACRCLASTSKLSPPLRLCRRQEDERERWRQQPILLGSAHRQGQQRPSWDRLRSFLVPYPLNLSGRHCPEAGRREASTGPNHNRPRIEVCWLLCLSYT